MMSSRQRRSASRPSLLLVALLVVMAAFAGLSPSSTVAQDAGAEAFFVPETRQLIAEPVLTAWLDLGGMDRLGHPVATAEEADGATTQHFERGVVRVANDTTEILPAGRALLDRPDPSAQLRNGRRSPAPKVARAFTPLRSAPASDSVLYDAESRHAVKGAMRAAHDDLGGEEALGAPLSEAHVTGETRVQWFEMGRLDERDGEVGLGPVGLELALLDGADVSPKRRGSFATLDYPGLLAARDGGNLGGAVGEPLSGSAGLTFAPARISIPAIGVDAYVESIGIDGGVMGTPSNPWNVGWYPALGGPGSNTVMAGHKDWAGVGPVVFNSLGALGAGSEIYLYDGAGNAATYVVHTNYAVDAYTDSGGIVNQGGDTLTLITCGGSFDGSMYNLRVIVHASRA